MSLTKITVDVAQIDPSHRIKPLCGVNKSPIEAGHYDLPPRSGPFLDYTLLYQLSGIQSVRTHGSSLDIGNIFRGQSGTWPYGVHEFVRDWAASQDFMSTPAIQALVDPDSEFEAAAASATIGGFIYELTRMQWPFSGASLGDCWLYWRPFGMAEVGDTGNYEWEANRARDAYLAIVNAGMEVYFRLGEGFHGPAYMGATAEDNVRGKALYAQAAAEVVHHLSHQQGNENQTEIPGFIEIINEPDAAGFIGPLDQPRSSYDPITLEWPPYSDREKLQQWCWDFQELYSDCVNALTSRGLPRDIIGSPGVTAHGARELVRYLGGGDQSVRSNDSKVYRLLHRLLEQDPSSVNFLAFHWYGEFQDVLLDTPTTVSMGFAAEIRDMVAALKEVAALYGADRPIHLNEWNLLYPKLPPDFLQYRDEMMAPLGIAVMSLGLTVMQHPDLDIERAHLYPAYSETNGLFNYDGGDFLVRPSAFAMRLHAGLEGDHWLPIRYFTGSEMPDGTVAWLEIAQDVIAATEQGVAVTALASRHLGLHGLGESRVSVVLTNMSEEAQDVTVQLNGLWVGTHGLKIKQLDESTLPGNVEIPAETMLIGGYVVPRVMEANQAFWTHDIDFNPDNGLGDTISVGPGGTYEQDVSLGPLAVVRIDLIAGAEDDADEEGVSEALSGDRGIIDVPEIEYTLPEGLVLPEWYKEMKRMEAEGRALGGLPTGRIDVQRGCHACLDQMREVMMERGYDVDERMKLLLLEYLAHLYMETGACPDQLDEDDWYAWFRMNSA